jgi:hypothetical protein
MPGIRRGIPASQLARDYGVSLNEFSESVIGLLGNEWPPADDAARLSRRREVCAAVSAAMIAAFDASTLAPEEREKLHPLIDEVLLPFWSKHCGQDGPDLATFVSTRSAHYLQGQVAESRVKSAVNMVGALLDAIDTPAHLRASLQERLVPAFAHRMVGDAYRINEVRRKFGIELSLLATIGALLQISVSYDPILRALRIV